MEIVIARKELGRNEGRKGRKGKRKKKTHVGKTATAPIYINPPATNGITRSLNWTVVPSKPLAVWLIALARFVPEEGVLPEEERLWIAMPMNVLGEGKRRC